MERPVGKGIDFNALRPDHLPAVWQPNCRHALALSDPESDGRLDVVRRIVVVSC